MKKKCFMILLLSVFIFLIAGCESLRFAPSQAQKENAWLHSRTTQLAADLAQTENTSEKLKGLTRLSATQSLAFTGYYGMPKQPPTANTANEILAQSSWLLAEKATSDAAQRPDTWELADSVIELGIGIAALFGGVYGTRAVSLLKQAKDKSKALHEIIVGNELFKRQHTEAASAFKSAHQNQSPQTRQLVAQMKM